MNIFIFELYVYFDVYYQKIQPGPKPSMPQLVRALDMVLMNKTWEGDNDSVRYINQVVEGTREGSV